MGGALAAEPMRIGLRAEIRTLLLERAGEEVFQASWAGQFLSQLYKFFPFHQESSHRLC